MARTKKPIPELTNIKDAAQKYGLRYYQVRDLVHRKGIQAQANPRATDRRFKWYPRGILEAYIRQEYALPQAA